MLPLRQARCHRSVFHTAMLRCRTRRQNHHWLIGKVAELAGTCRADREVFQLARDRKRELWLNPENGRHGLFICREGRKPGTRNGSSVGGRPAADEAYQMTRHSFSAGGQKKSDETNHSEAREERCAPAYFGSNTRQPPVMLRRRIPFRWRYWINKDHAGNFVRKSRGKQRHRYTTARMSHQHIRGRYRRSVQERM